ncbi:sporulation protein YpjB [Virgibacillus ainsalahensis]
MARRVIRYACLSAILFIVIVIHLQISDSAILADSTTPASSSSAKENSDLTPFFWTAGIIGGCIAITLTYVSWRKYKGEKKQDEKDKMID